MGIDGVAAALKRLCPLVAISPASVHLATGRFRRVEVFAGLLQGWSPPLLPPF